MSSPILISLTFFCLVGAAATALYAALGDRHRLLQDRFAELAIQIRLAQEAGEDEEGRPSGLGDLLFRWIVKRVPKPKLDTPRGEKLSQMLAQAGFFKSSAATIYQAVRLVLTVGLAIIGLAISFLFGASPAHRILWPVGAGVIGYVAPGYFIGRRARARQGEITRQLSDVLDLLVVCVEAGLGLFEAIKLIGNETVRHKQAIGEELALVSNEISAGASLGDALRGLAERTAVEDIRPLAATLIQSEQLGAQIAPALRASSDGLRARRKLRAEEGAQKTTIKILFPLVLFVLPAMMMVIIGPAIVQILHTLSGS
jgi:tight adherence protein C